jgi:hypothetical protein
MSKRKATDELEGSNVLSSDFVCTAGKFVRLDK